MGDIDDAAGLTAGEEIKPYKIHVSTKYLDLTKQKLELTRLPHELSEPRSEDWWEPKPQVEPLIDFWLEKYDWRDQEKALNDIPQFRTAFSIPSSEAPLRLHFIHIRSPHANALPLLLVPPFPFSNLSFAHLVKPFTEPEDVANNQPFHVVIPSLPGLGFSDPFPNNTPEISTTAEILDTLMSRLSYPHYLVTNAGPAQSSPAEIDWKLVSHIATNYPASCVGAHFISPPLASPKLAEAPWEWTKWSIASFFHAGILGYSDDDFSALKGSGVSLTFGDGCLGRRKKEPTPRQLGLNKFGLREPNTLAYAMCDSPTGLLVFVLKGLRLLGPRMQFTQEQVVNLTQLAWLPGPEYAMRFWAHCAVHDEEAEKRREQARANEAAATKPKVAITVFLGGREDEPPAELSHIAAEVRAVPLPREEKARYVCPAWGNAHYDVIFAQRTPGKAGLLSWERPEIIAAGVRGLAKEVLKLDKRIQPAAAPATAPLEQIVIPEERAAASGSPTPTAVTVAAAADVPKAPPTQAHGESSAKAVETSPSPKGKEPERASAAGTGTGQKHGDTKEVFSDQESPDTLVENASPLSV